MSESPRLSRKQLREMGKLAVKPESAPALTDTQELRLRRPSRRELREAERAERERNEKLEAKEIAQKLADERGEKLSVLGTGEPVTVRKSVFARFEDNSAQVLPAQNNKLPEAHDRVWQGNKEGYRSRRRIAADEFTQLAVGQADSQRKANTAIGGITGNAKFEADYAPAANPDEAHENSAELAQGSLRDQLFARMRTAEKEQFAPEMVNSVKTGEAESSFAAKAEVQDDAASLDSTQIGRTDGAAKDAHSNTVAAVEEEQSGSAAKGLRIADVPKKEESVNESLGFEKSAEDALDEGESENADTSSWTWFIFLILAIIAVLLGILGGSWINSTFFSAEVSPFNSVSDLGVFSS